MDRCSGKCLLQQRFSGHGDLFTKLAYYTTTGTSDFEASIPFELNHASCVQTLIWRLQRVKPRHV